MPDKPLAWLGSSLEDVRAFPADARRDAGYQLRRVQQGLLPSGWKPMTSVGSGVREIRISTQLAHRVFYIATFEEAVYVLHAFDKRTRQTAQGDVDLAKTRLADLMKQRAKKRKTAEKRKTQ